MQQRQKKKKLSGDFVLQLGLKGVLIMGEIDPIVGVPLIESIDSFIKI